MSSGSGSTYPPNVTIPPPNKEETTKGVSPHAKLSFQNASQAQIVRAHQRDSSQVSRLVDVLSELIRSIFGTRWLALRQPTIDFLVRATYLALTLGRGLPTLGEEYTDILPRTPRSAHLSKLRRASAVLLLLLPTVITTSTVSQRIRGHFRDTSTLSRLRHRLANLLDSPAGQNLAELHMIAFLYGGRYLEFGRRMAGMTYVSTSVPRPEKRPSYEPLALLLLLPLLTRLWRSRRSRLLDGGPIDSHHPSLVPGESKPSAQVEIGDEPNTYLTAEASATDSRQCTLCLEARGTGEGSRGTVAVTECGHVFCWGCLGGLDKPECPLCRQALRMERLIAAYNL